MNLEKNFYCPYVNDRDCPDTLKLIDLGENAPNYEDLLDQKTELCQSASYDFCPHYKGLQEKVKLQIKLGQMKIK